jgi:hypothetical protein
MKSLHRHTSALLAFYLLGAKALYPDTGNDIVNDIVNDILNDTVNVGWSGPVCSAPRSKSLTAKRSSVDII